MRLGRLDEARDLLIACRDVFEADQRHRQAGQDAERARRRRGRARPHRAGGRPGTRRAALQVPAWEPEAIAVSHHNLANYLQRGERRPAAGRRAPDRRRPDRLPDRQRQPRQPLDGVGPAAAGKPRRPHPAASARCAPSSTRSTGCTCRPCSTGSPRQPTRRPRSTPSSDAASQAAPKPTRTLVAGGIRCWPPCTPRSHDPDADTARPPARPWTGRSTGADSMKTGLRSLPVLRRIQAGERDRDTLDRRPGPDRHHHHQPRPGPADRHRPRDRPRQLASHRPSDADDADCRRPLGRRCWWRPPLATPEAQERWRRCWTSGQRTLRPGPWPPCSASSSTATEQCR